MGAARTQTESFAHQEPTFTGIMIKFLRIFKTSKRDKLGRVRIATGAGRPRERVPKQRYDAALVARLHALTAP